MVTNKNSYMTTYEKHSNVNTQTAIDYINDMCSELALRSVLKPERDTWKSKCNYVLACLSLQPNNWIHAAFRPSFSGCFDVVVDFIDSSGERKYGVGKYENGLIAVDGYKEAHIIRYTIIEQ